MPDRARCWQSNVEHARLTRGEGSPEWRAALDRPCTCLLPAGHAGPHEWTFDGDVTFTFGTEADRTPGHPDRS